MFQIISDGSCDLSPEQLKTAGLSVVPFYVTLDGTSYRKEAEELSVRDFYEYCIQHPECTPRTSMPSVQDYAETFRRYLEQGNDILCYCISRTLSGSINSAIAARDLLKEDYPDRRIEIVDSMLVTGLQGALLFELSEYAKKDHSLEETLARGEEIKKNALMFFTLEDLSYLARGGRIGKVADLAVRSLNIRPLICFQKGEIQPQGFSIGRKNSIDKIVELAKKTIRERNLTLSDYTFGMGWGYDKAEAGPLFRQIEELFREQFGEVPEFLPIQVGATIGVHTGPNPLGFGFIEKAEH